MGRSFPHCDALVLHRPTTCEICDTYAADLQQERIARGVNFTGEYDKNKEGCPSELRRSKDIIERWPRNRPMPWRPEGTDESI